MAQRYKMAAEPMTCHEAAQSKASATAMYNPRLASPRDKATRTPFFGPSHNTGPSTYGRQPRKAQTLQQVGDVGTKHFSGLPHFQGRSSNQVIISLLLHMPRNISRVYLDV